MCIEKADEGAVTLFQRQISGSSLNHIPQSADDNDVQPALRLRPAPLCH